MTSGIWKGVMARTHICLPCWREAGHELETSKENRPAKKLDEKRRDKLIRIQPEYHLIVTEGMNTEPSYFQVVRDIINRQYQHKIHLDIHGEGDNTLSLFEKAKMRAFQNPNGYKHVWIVYDTDDFPAAHINKTAELCQTNTTQDTKYHAVWSNQCIKLRFLLHFGYFQSDIHRNEYWPKPSEQLRGIGAGEYTKNRHDMYAVLRPFMDAVRYYELTNFLPGSIDLEVLV